MKTTKSSFEENLAAMQDVFGTSNKEPVNKLRDKTAESLVVSAAVMFLIGFLRVWPSTFGMLTIAVVTFITAAVGMLWANSDGKGGTTVGALVVLVGACWLGWSAFQTPADSTVSTPSGILVAHSNAPVATLFYRKVGAERWHYVDCSPQVRVMLPPGRYQTRIEGVGGHVISRERELEVLSSQQADLTPDG